jgi:FHA domain-containing protein
MPELAGPHAASAVELKERLDTERRGRPFLIVRDGNGSQRLITLHDDRSPMTVGRSEDCDLPLPWDSRVSRVHAEINKIGPSWAVTDGGLSRNGTYVNGERITERRLLRDGDTLRMGDTAVLYREPSVDPPTAGTTALDRELPGPGDVSPAQKAVLRALCRPFAEADPGEWARPATNREIASDLVLSLGAIKAHLRVLFARFDVAGLPQNEKRLRLAERALHSGAVTLAELRRGR